MNNRQSVIVPVKNGAIHIAEGLQSALVQLAADDEIIVIEMAQATTRFPSYAPSAIRVSA